MNNPTHKELAPLSAEDQKKFIGWEFRVVIPPDHSDLDVPVESKTEELAIPVPPPPLLQVTPETSGDAAVIPTPDTETEIASIQLEPQEYQQRQTSYPSPNIQDNDNPQQPASFDRSDQSPVAISPRISIEMEGIPLTQEL